MPAAETRTSPSLLNVVPLLVFVTSIAIAAVAAGSSVAQRLDALWVDSCQFGAGEGSRCLTGDANAPRLVLAAWPIGGLAVAGAGAAVVALSRRLDRIRTSAGLGADRCGIRNGLHPEASEYR